MKTNKPSPCAFCLSESVHVLHDYFDGEGKLYCVFCQTCGASGARREKRKAAVEGWNSIYSAVATRDDALRQIGFLLENDSTEKALVSIRDEMPLGLEISISISSDGISIFVEDGDMRLFAEPDDILISHTSLVNRLRLALAYAKTYEELDCS